VSDKTLGKARGLNSIANPRDFKGSSGRRRQPSPEAAPPPPPPPGPVEERPPPAARRDDGRQDRPTEPPPDPLPDRRPDPRAEAAGARPTDRVPPGPLPESNPATADAVPPTKPHRAVTPGINRKRRELSVPHKIADAVERTGINPADVVMSGYRKHSDAIYAGAGGRMVARGRTRLRLSISDAEFDQLTRLGQARGWNRSETVSVILALELLSPSVADAAAPAPG